jgi:hypothetical protein
MMHQRYGLGRMGGPLGTGGNFALLQVVGGTVRNSLIRGAVLAIAPLQVRWRSDSV